MMRSWDVEKYREAAALYPEGFPSDFDYDAWLFDGKNIMYVIGDDVGLASYEYPGVYNAHWFFKSRGKKALDTAFTMYDRLFNHDGAEAVRGLTPLRLKGARFLAKRIGFQTVDTIYGDGEPYEVMILTKQVFNDEQDKRNG